MTQRPPKQIALTPEQQAQIRQLTGKEVTIVRLKLESLEERLVPGLKLN